MCEKRASAPRRATSGTGLGARALGVIVELHFLNVPHEERWRRIEARNAEATWGAVPITCEQLAGWDPFFEPLTSGSWPFSTGGDYGGTGAAVSRAGGVGGGEGLGNAVAAAVGGTVLVAGRGVGSGVSSAMAVTVGVELEPPAAAKVRTPTSANAAIDAATRSRLRALLSHVRSHSTLAMLHRGGPGATGVSECSTGDQRRELLANDRQPPGTRRGGPSILRQAQDERQGGLVRRTRVSTEPG